MIKLIASDLDGTLIPEGTQSFEPGFFEVLERILGQGIRFYAVSGRQYANMQDLFGAYADRIGFISENGAFAAEGGRQLYLDKLPEDLVRAMAEEILKIPQIEICLCGRKACYIRPRTAWFDNQMRNVIKAETRLLSELPDADDPIVKVSMYVYDFPENATMVIRHFTERFGDAANFICAGNDWVDLQRKGTGKGATLKAVLGQLGIAPEEILVFGDNQNDISMMEITPNSYCVAHAAPEVQAHAAHLCRNVTEFLRYFTA